MRKWIIATVMALAIGGFAVVNIMKLRSAPAAAGGQGPEGAQLVKVATVETREITQKVSAPATLEASRVREVRAPFASAQVTLKVGLGDQVTEGQVIAVLLADDLNLQMMQQRLSVSRSEMGLDSLKRQRSASPTARKQKVKLAELQLTQANQAVLAAEKLGDALALEQARAQAESARLALDAAKDTSDEEQLALQIITAELELTIAKEAQKELTSKLEQATVKAPVAGTILSLGLKEGQPASPGMPLAEIGRLDPLVVRARIDEVDVPKVKQPMPLTLTANAFLGERFAGTVTRVAPQATAADMRQMPANLAPVFDVQGEVKNPDGKLRPGMSVLVAITTESRPKALVVGVESLREEGDKVAVLVVRGHTVRVIPIKVGLRTEIQAEVLSGLQEGDEVVVGPFTAVRDLKEGTTVRTELTAPRTAEDGS